MAEKTLKPTVQKNCHTVTTNIKTICRFEIKRLHCEEGQCRQMKIPSPPKEIIAFRSESLIDKKGWGERGWA